jgi:adenosylhomocysteinase
VEIEMAELEKYATKKREVREHVTAYEVPGKSKVKGSRSKVLYVLGGGRLVNLAAAEGHPADVMDMSFANQALAAEWFVKQQGKLKPQVYRLAQNIDKRVARLKLDAMGVKFDRLTKEQKKYLSSWQEGT